MSKIVPCPNCGKTGWISVDDELPPPNRHVWIHYESGIFDIDTFDDPAIEVMEFLGITHWQLPTTVGVV